MEVHVYRDWIKRHLPSSIPDERIEAAFNFSGYYQDGLTIMAYGERGGPDIVVYEAEDEQDLCLWQFKQICYRIAGDLELANRSKNDSKWRWLRDHAENGRWMYIERRDYVYKTIEDSRLDTFEVYLRLLEPVLPAEEWEECVDEYVGLMNRWFKKDHWGYDRKALRFVEISDSMQYTSDRDDTEEPQPDQIIKVI